MYNQNKNGKILNILLGIIALFIIIFIIAWVVNKGNKDTEVNTEVFENNLQTMHDKAGEYFASDLPQEIGDSSLLSLDDLYDLGLVDTLTYGSEKCDSELSYVSIVKTSANEYKIKSNLVCGNKSDTKTEKITSNIIVNDNEGNTIIDSTQEDVELDVETSTKEDENDKVNCVGVVCTFTQIETTCSTKYKYEYVKRNVSCPTGYTLKNGLCIKTNTTSIDANKQYSEEEVKVVQALVNPGSQYKVYTDYTISGGETTKSCKNGTLVGDACYEYAEKIDNTTSSCPEGYTQNGNSCYKYTDIITNTTSSCPEGYTQNGNYCYKYTNANTSTSTSCPSGYTKDGNYCYKYTNPTSNTTYSCPNGYEKDGSKCVKTVNASKTYSSWGNPTKTYSTSKKESTYSNDTEKKVLVGTNKIGSTTMYTYAIYKRSYSYTCVTGSLSGSKCYVYANQNATTSTSCPSGYTQSGSKCYKKTNLTTTTSTSCPSGYTKDGNTCYIKTNLNTNTTSSCPSGYTQSGNTCYIKTNLNTNTTKVCPSGYTESGDKCYIKSNPIINTTEIVYNCPSGFTKTGTGKDTKCYKYEKNNDEYYCENADATLNGKLCYYTQAGSFTGYSCPSGYSLNGNTCSKTTTSTATPIWTNAEVIYSYENYLEGYQKTGVKEFVTTCTRVNPIK